MRSIHILCCVAIAVVLAFVRASYGDGEIPEEPDEPIDETAEPITGEPVMPNPGSEQPMRDPFTPYDIGGPAAAWRLEDLTPDEQEVALRGVDANPQQVQSAYASAVAALAQRYASEHAADQLHINALDQLGVVP